MRVSISPLRTMLMRSRPQVSHCIIDAMILTERWKVLYGDEWYAEKSNDIKHRVDPLSIAKVRGSPVG